MSETSAAKLSQKVADIAEIYSGIEVNKGIALKDLPTHIQARVAELDARAFSPVTILAADGKARKQILQSLAAYATIRHV